jgi:L-asparaginase/Glu-tRNA(Gln) amidotransferase subunit D
VLAGATATILGTDPLVTSNKARILHGLAPRSTVDGKTHDGDVLRPQRLAAPVRVFIEQFSAHPLERDAEHLYGPPDGYVDAQYDFHRERTAATDVPVYEAELRPEDGLYMLPYMALRSDGSAWDGDSADSIGDETSRQPFFPDASRLFEEIDRLGVGPDGWGLTLARSAEFDFIRAAPSGGYRRGLKADLRTDVGSGDIAAERRGEDFFPYRPAALRTEPTRLILGKLTNTVQRAAQDARYAGLIWLEGSPNLEETLYWLSLLIDTRLPIVGCAAQRAHGSLGAEGDRNIVDAVTYITSGVWRNAAGEDCIGPVALQDQLIFSARELFKINSRPGGFRAGGLTGGVLGLIDHRSVPHLEFEPRRRFTHDSEVNLKRLAPTTAGLAMEQTGRAVATTAEILDSDGWLIPQAMPVVSIVKMGRYQDDPTAATWVNDVAMRIGDMLSRSRLAGIVAEGAAPYGTLTEAANDALRSGVFRGVPVVRVGRGTPEGIARSDESDVFLSGSNLSATKARLVLMACLLRYGALPPANDPDRPTGAELAAMRHKLDQFQQVFDTH